MKNTVLFLIAFWVAVGVRAQGLDVDLATAADAPKASIQGNLWAQTGLYHAVGVPARTNAFTWSMGANAVADLNGWSLPFAFAVGQYGGRLDTPTFGQLGVSPTYKWAKGHFGHRNLQFSPYTLGGHTFLGAGVELTPGMFRFAAMVGRLRQTVRPQNNLVNLLPTYRRTGMGFKIGTGTADNYIDLIFFKAKDDPSSLAAPQDSTLQPAENVVLGINSHLKLGKHLSATIDGAASMFNRNQYSTQVDPESLGAFSRWPRKLLPVRYSSRINFAGKAGLHYTRDAFRLGVQYERIDPEYESMGTFFFLNDIENVTVAPVFSLFKRKVSVSGQWGVQRNNLLDSRSESTRRWIGNANITYADAGKPFGLMANYTNFTIQQSDGRLELSDTIRLSLVTTSVNVSPYWNWVTEARTRTLTVSGNYQVLNDRNPFTREYTDMASVFFTGVYSLFANTSGWGGNVGVQYNTLQVFNLDTDRYGLTAGVSRSLDEGRVHLSLNGSYNLTRISTQPDGATSTANASLTWVPAERWNVSAYGNYLRNASEQFDSYTEWIGGLRLGLRW